MKVWRLGSSFFARSKTNHSLHSLANLIQSRECHERPTFQPLTNRNMKLTLTLSGDTMKLRFAFFFRFFKASRYGLFIVFTLLFARNSCRFFLRFWPLFDPFFDPRFCLYSKESDPFYWPPFGIDFWPPTYRHRLMSFGPIRRGWFFDFGRVLAPSLRSRGGVFAIVMRGVFDRFGRFFCVLDRFLKIFDENVQSLRFWWFFWKFLRFLKIFAIFLRFEWFF